MTSSHQIIFDDLDEKEQEYIQSAFDEYKELVGHSSKSISNLNKKAIESLELNKKQQTNMMKKLKQYRFISNVEHLKIGNYVRWIPFDSDTMNNGGILVDIEITTNGTLCKCKNGFYHSFFQFYFNDALVFQKLSSKELIILYAVDAISKNKH